MTTPLLDCLVIEPRRRASAAVIWLHGLGASYHDFPPIVPELGLPVDHGIRFVFPQAPSIAVTVNGGAVMPAWYDILSMDFGRRVDEAGVRKSARHLDALIERERERGIAANRIVLAGFSQGGAIALHVALRFHEALAGALLLSTYIAADCDLDDERSKANAELPIFQAHGTMDPMVAYGLGRAAYTRLSKLGYAVDWREYPMQHQVVPEEIADVGAWLRARLP